MKKPQEYADAYKNLKQEVYQDIVDLMEKLGVDKVDLSKNEDGETYKDFDWYNREAVYITNMSDERRYYIVELQLSYGELYFIIWNEDADETFQDSFHIEVPELISIYRNICRQFGLFESSQEETEE